MSKPAAPKATMNVWSVTALGIGAMVGAGIFALLGQAELLAHGNVWLAFIIGGVVALFSGFSFARLSERYPSKAGIVAFFNAGFRSRIVAGSQSLIHLMTLAVATALIAKSFGSYSARLAFGDGGSHIWVNAFATAIVIALTTLNVVGSRAVGRAELAFVIIKLTALGALLVAGSASFQMSRLASLPGASGASTVAAAGLVFFAYAGYGIMANASGDVAKPRRVMAWAIFGSIGFVMLLYVSISIIVLANVSESDLLKYADTAVAQAAEPVMGSTGFAAISIAALFATASAINAMLFSSMNIAYGLGIDRQLPSAFTAFVYRKLSKGVFISVLGVLVMVNCLDLSSIADIASAAFLITYLAVFLAHWQLAKETNSSRAVIAVGAALMATVLVVFEMSVYHSHPLSIVLTAALVAGAVLIEFIIVRWPHPIA